MEGSAAIRMYTEVLWGILFFLYFISFKAAKCILSTFVVVIRKHCDRKQPRYMHETCTLEASFCFPLVPPGCCRVKMVNKFIYLWWGWAAWCCAANKEHQVNICHVKNNSTGYLSCCAGEMAVLCHFYIFSSHKAAIKSEDEDIRLIKGQVLTISPSIKMHKDVVIKRHPPKKVNF